MSDIDIERRPGQGVLLLDRAGRTTVIEVLEVQMIGDRVRLRIRGPWVQRHQLCGGPGEAGAPAVEINLESSR